MRIRYAFLPILVLNTALQAQVRMPATTKVGLMELQALADKYPDASKLVTESQGKHPTALIHGRCMVGFLGKVNAAFDAAAFSGDQLMLGARKGDILSFRVDAYQLDIVHALSGVDYIELAGKVAPHLDRAVRVTRADSVHRGIDLPQSYTGADVLIGITDWGFDYSHPMFYDTAMVEYRVRAAWDHYRQAGPAPDSFTYGTELSTPEALLEAQADTANIYSFATHGTHVGGIAGGGGAGTAYRGFAFDAKFLFCTFLVDAAAVLDAFDWMQTIAEQDDKRLVINMSWGLYYIGTLDGNSLISQAIEQFAQEGVAFANSGGNNGDIDFHIRKDFNGDLMRSRIQFYPYNAHAHMWGQSISMWGEAGNAFSAGLIVTNNSNQVQAETPLYSTATQAAYLDSSIIVGEDTVYFNLTADAEHPLNGRPHFRLRVANRAAGLKVALKATAPSGRVHFWNLVELDNGVGNWGQEFQAVGSGWTAGDGQYGISEPACTEALVTVAAYATEYENSNGTFGGGPITYFSSRGPTLDERIKPDIAAPGLGIVSSMSSYTDDDFTPFATVEFEGRTYPFAALSGTSMSGPAVAGIIALLLQADPEITPAEIRDVIKGTARVDNSTGAIPDGGSTTWGFGKVNAYRAVRQVLGLTSLPEHVHGTLAVWPNPTTGEVYIAADGHAGPARIRVTDIAGRIVLERNKNLSGNLTLDISALTTGLYQVHVEQDGGAFVATLVKE
ncbi:MAG: S8 family peptidase [Flavobacteriales bacterium]|nr:S8 family peptidase [Flavobacteriales bacterium]